MALGFTRENTPRRMLYGSFITGFGSVAIGLGSLLVLNTEQADIAAVAQPAQSDIDQIHAAEAVLGGAAGGTVAGLAGMAISATILTHRMNKED